MAGRVTSSETVKEGCVLESSEATGWTSAGRGWGKEGSGEAGARPTGCRGSPELREG